jgi:hypothetical protein
VRIASRRFAISLIGTLQTVWFAYDLPDDHLARAQDERRGEVMRTAVDYELAARGHQMLSDEEIILLLAHPNWGVQTATNMILQLRRGH